VLLDRLLNVYPALLVVFIVEQATRPTEQEDRVRGAAQSPTNKVQTRSRQREAGQDGEHSASTKLQAARFFFVMDGIIESADLRFNRLHYPSSSDATTSPLNVHATSDRVLTARQTFIAMLPRHHQGIREGMPLPSSFLVPISQSHRFLRPARVPRSAPLFAIHSSAHLALFQLVLQSVVKSLSSHSALNR